MKGGGEEVVLEEVFGVRRWGVGVVDVKEVVNRRVMGIWIEGRRSVGEIGEDVVLGEWVVGIEGVEEGMDKVDE